MGKTEVVPVQKVRLQRLDWVHILDAYTQNGVKGARVFPGSRDEAAFEHYIDHAFIYILGDFQILRLYLS